MFAFPDAPQTIVVRISGDEVISCRCQGKRFHHGHLAFEQTGGGCPGAGSSGVAVVTEEYGRGSDGATGVTLQNDTLQRIIRKRGFNSGVGFGPERTIAIVNVVDGSVFGVDGPG